MPHILFTFHWGPLRVKLRRPAQPERHVAAEAGSHRSARCGRESEINCYTLFSGCVLTFTELTALRVRLFEKRELGVRPQSHSQLKPTAGIGFN